MIKESNYLANLETEHLDSISRTVIKRWQTAMQWRNSEKLDDSNVSSVMRDCYNQRNGILSAEDRAVVEEIGSDYYINLSALKSGALTSILRDTLVTPKELPILVKPTPIPELSEEALQEILAKVKRALYVDNFQGDLAELIKGLKEAKYREVQSYAANAARKMQELINDQCTEGGFYRALNKFLHDFAVYPFAVMHGPIPVAKPRSVWSGNKFTTKIETAFEFVPTSVWDFFWLPDCTTAQNGTGVFVRERLTKQALYQCTTMKSYIQENVLKALEDVSTGNLPLAWTSENPEQPTNTDNTIFGDGTTVEVLRHYGLMSGQQLSEYNISGLEPLQYYETQVSMVGKYVIQVILHPDQSNPIRPVYTASYETSSDRIPGVSICQKIRDVERAYINMLRLVMVNAGYASGPIGEVDMSRIHRYMDEDTIGRIVAGVIQPVDPSPGAGGQPAHYFHQVPSQTASFINAMEYFSALADRVTGLPASLHGEPVGTGANRTFRGMAMLYNNAQKPIQSGVSNIDESVFAPLGTLLYNYNMLYSDDDSIKGDAKVDVQGSTGLLQREIKKQQAMELLQVVISVGGAANQLNPKVLEHAIMKLLENYDIPTDLLTMNTPDMQPASGDIADNTGQGAPI